jgi:predicted porin
MKKSLIALSVLATVAASANAQSNISIYGIADAGFVYSKNGSGDNVTAIGSGVQSGSRLGFRGAEDIGGGTKAIFTLEQGYNINDGTQGQGRLFGRQSFVGLNNSHWGELRLGRQYNPIRPALESVNPFEIGLAGNILNIFDAHGERADNTVNYQTPKISGFSAQAAYSFGQNATQDLGRQRGVSANYANGPVYVVLAYHNTNTLNSTTTPTAETGDKHTTMLGGVYNFGILKAHAAYAQNKGENATGVTNLDSKDMMVGVTVPVGGAGKFLASYMRKKNDLISNGDSKLWAIGYTYDLSKRTDLYASYGKMDNDSGVNRTLASSALGAIANGADPSTFNIGMRHKF